VLKKVRVAFELKDDDIIALLQMTGLRMSRPSSALSFASPTRELSRAWGPDPQKSSERPVIAVTSDGGIDYALAS